MPLDEDTWPARQQLRLGLHAFFGELRGNYRFPNMRLYDQFADGLAQDELAGAVPEELPEVGTGLYLDTGNTRFNWPLYAAVTLTNDAKVTAAALLDSDGLTIFLRSSSSGKLYEPIFKKWAYTYWSNPQYAGLGYGFVLNSTESSRPCSKLSVTIIVLHGYSNRSVN